MKGWELLKEIEEENIKEGTIIGDNYRKYIVKGGHLKYLDIDEYVSCWALIKNEFRIIGAQKEINIQDIEPMQFIPRGYDMYDLAQEEISIINVLIQAIKQLNKEVKEMRKNDSR